MAAVKSFCHRACKMSGITLCFLKPSLLILDFYPQGVYTVQKDRQAKLVSATSCDTSYNGALQSSSHITFSHLLRRQPGQLCCRLQMRKQSKHEAKWLVPSAVAIEVQTQVWIQVFCVPSRGSFTLLYTLDVWCESILFFCHFYQLSENICVTVYILLLVV